MRKICRRCKKEKDLEEFYKHNKMKDGHLNICIECKLGDKNKYYYENQEKILEDGKIYIEKHKEQVNKTKKICYEKNKEQYLEHQKEYYKENKEEKKKKSREYYHSHREQEKKRIKEKRARGEYYFIDFNHRHKRRAQCNETDITPKWLKQLKKDSIYCPLCGKIMIETKVYHPDQKQLDHIIQLWEGGKHMMNNVRYACADCNNRRPKPTKY